MGNPEISIVSTYNIFKKSHKQVASMSVDSNIFTQIRYLEFMDTQKSNGKSLQHTMYTPQYSNHGLLSQASSGCLPRKQHNNKNKDR